MLKLVAKDFNLDYTVDCGQAFRFKKIGDIQRGVLGNLVLDIRQDQNALFVESHPKKANLSRIIKGYFNLDVDLRHILTKIDTDEYIHCSIEKYKGLRIINQDIWECLASYIISQRKRIVSIKKNIEIFAKTFGRRIWEDNFSFPHPRDILRRCRNLKRCRLGYREPYIFNSVSKILKEKIDLGALKNYSTDEAKSFLKEFLGVGDKVADCVLLYALRRYEVFPIDTWIRHVMISRYIKRNVSDQYIRDFARERWSNFAGFAQIYLFYYSRTHERSVKFKA